VTTFCHFPPFDDELDSPIPFFGFFSGNSPEKSRLSRKKCRLKRSAVPNFIAHLSDAPQGADDAMILNNKENNSCNM
jgi:hypothetical protein